MALCTYIDRLPRLVQEEDPSLVPPTDVLTELVEAINEIRRIAQGAKTWIKRIEDEAYILAEELVGIHDKALAILSQIHCIEETWEDEHIY